LLLDGQAKNEPLCEKSSPTTLQTQNKRFYAFWKSYARKIQSAITDRWHFLRCSRPFPRNATFSNPRVENWTPCERLSSHALICAHWIEKSRSPMQRRPNCSFLRFLVVNGQPRRSQITALELYTLPPGSPYRLCPLFLVQRYYVEPANNGS
jgi:hypothetical protein